MFFKKNLGILGLIILILIGCAPKQEQPVQTITKDDVVALVEKAVEYIKTHGKEKALEEFMNVDGEFIQGELYVFADAFDGTALATIANPEFVGQNLMDVTDSRGMNIMPKMIEIAKQGSGWLEYFWTNPVSKKDERKLTYVMKVDETWFVGAGMYAKEKE